MGEGRGVAGPGAYIYIYLHNIVQRIHVQLELHSKYMLFFSIYMPSLGFWQIPLLLFVTFSF